MGVSVDWELTSDTGVTGRKIEVGIVLFENEMFVLGIQLGISYSKTTCKTLQDEFASIFDLTDFDIMTVVNHLQSVLTLS